MMKKMLNRGISASGAASDELKLSALLGSSYVDKIVEEQNVKLLAQRDRHASELKLLIAEELKLIPEFDKNVSKAQADVEEKFTALQAARGSWESCSAIEIISCTGHSTSDNFMKRNFESWRHSSTMRFASSEILWSKTRISGYRRRRSPRREAIFAALHKRSSFFRTEITQANGGQMSQQQFVNSRG